MIDWGYQHDCHVLDWWLWREAQRMAPWLLTPKRKWFTLRHDPEDWTRYDGELL